MAFPWNLVIIYNNMPLFCFLMFLSCYTCRCIVTFYFTISEQVKEIRKTTLAGIMCKVIPELTEIQAEPLKVASLENPVVSCSSFQELDLSHWKE